MKDIVITGANGYIGRYVARAARAQGCHIVAATRRAVELAPATTWMHYDLREQSDATLFPTGALLVHLAADTGAGDATDEAMELTAANRLLRIAQERDLRFVFVSSQTARPDAPTTYGRTKWRIEQEVLRQGGAVIRPGMVYGGELAGLFGRLAHFVRSHRILPVFVPAPVVQPVHVEDVAQAILRIGQRLESRGRCYNVAAIDPVRFDAFLRAIAQHRLRVRRAFVPVPITLVQLAFNAANALLRTRLDAARLRSLADLPQLETRRDLHDLELSLRPLQSGMQPRGDAQRRDLIIEARALVRYVLGSAPASMLIRRYVRAIECVHDGRALDLPQRLWRGRAWMHALDDRSTLDVTASELVWRLDAATVLAEATPAGARQFLALPQHAGALRGAIDISVAMLLEALRRALQLVVRPSRWRVQNSRHA